MVGSLLDVYQGIVLLEYEVLTKFGSNSLPLSNNFALSTTVVPSLVFSMGRRPLSVRSSVNLIGLGVAHNFVAGTPTRAYGLLQKLGTASLLVAVNQESYWGPVAALSLWQFVSTYFAKNTHKPFASRESTGQTQLDRKLVGESHMLDSSYDPDGPLPTLMASAAMWFGQWCFHNLDSYDESFITGMSLLSLGYMFWYAFPQNYPFSQTFWTPSFSITTSGISLLKYTALELIYQLLIKTSKGSALLSLFSDIGRHSVSLFFISSAIKQTGVMAGLEKKLQSFKLSSTAARVVSAVSQCVLIGASALALNRIGIPL